MEIIYENIKILKYEKYATIAESTQFPLPWDPTSLSLSTKKLKQTWKLILFLISFFYENRFHRENDLGEAGIFCFSLSFPQQKWNKHEN